MKTYQAVRAEILKLQQQAEALRQRELKEVIASVRKTIAEFGLSLADLGLGRGAGKAAGRAKAAGKPARRGRGSVGVAKYRDPKTGDTWTGRGRPPSWIVAAKNRNAFLIAGAAEAAAPSKPGAKAKAAARPAAKRAKAAKKGAAKKVAAKKTAPKKAAAKKVARKNAKSRAPVRTPAVQVESGVASE
jgi:DNA-binding protein H-NS